MAESPCKSNRGYLQSCAESALAPEAHPVSSTGLKIDSEVHDREARTNGSRTANLGVLVQGGHSKKAKRRNRSYNRSLGDSYRPISANKSHKKRRRAAAKIREQHSIRSTLTHNGSRPAESLKHFEGIVNPVPGEIYQVAQRSRGNNDLSWYLVVPLPLSDW